MTHRFYFDLENDDEIIRDDEGVEASNLEQAIIVADAVLKEMQGSKDAIAAKDGWTLIIRDKSGSSLKKLPVA